LADIQNITFEKTIQDGKWHVLMDNEIRAMEHNNMWELFDLPKKSWPIGIKKEDER